MDLSLRGLARIFVHTNEAGLKTCACPCDSVRRTPSRSERKSRELRLSARVFKVEMSGSIASQSYSADELSNNSELPSTSMQVVKYAETNHKKGLLLQRNVICGEIRRE